MNLQSQAIYVNKLFFKKILHILEDDASSVQVGILFIICLKYDKLH